MEIHQHLQIGTHHTNNCEDFLVVQDIGSNNVLLSVMDGCTMGKESHFASVLIGKIIRKACRDEYYKEYSLKGKTDIRELLKRVLQSIVSELKSLQNQLNLDKYELLSTLLIGILDVEKNEFFFLVIGDGLVVINNEFLEFDQDNVPDYLGYHLGEDFDDYYSGISTYHHSDVKDISLSTDGVFTFSKYKKGVFPEKTEKSILYDLFVDKEKFNGERRLIKTLLNIEEEFGLKPTDDVGIVRVIIND